MDVWVIEPQAVLYMYLRTVVICKVYKYTLVFRMGISYGYIVYTTKVLLQYVLADIRVPLTVPWA